MESPQTLTQIVTGLEPRIRTALSALRIELRDGEAIAALSISLMTAPRGRGVTIDLEDMPEGVAVTGAERWPDIIRAVTTDVAMDQQIRELDGSGLVGRLDAVRWDRGPEALAAGYARIGWTIKTHAGSDGERLAWMQQLPPNQLTRKPVTLAPLSAEDIRTLRTRLGLTQRALAERLNADVPGLRTDQVTVSRWERGEFAPSGPALAALRGLRWQTRNSHTASRGQS